MHADYAGLRAIWAVERRFCSMGRGLLWPRASRDTGRAMSQENVEIVRRAQLFTLKEWLISASRRAELTAVMATLHPAIEWTTVESDPAFTVLRGHHEVGAWLVDGS